MCLRDRDMARTIFSSPEVDARINAQIVTLSGLLKLGQESVSLALVADTDTYAVPNSPGTTYTQVVDVARNSDNYPVTVATRETFAERLIGTSGATQGRSRGRPDACCLWEEPDNTLTIQVDPVPRAQDIPESLLIFRSVKPAAVENDADSIPFDVDAQEALVYATAAELVDMATDEALEQVRLSRSASEIFRGNVRTLLRAHDLRRARQRATQKVRRSGRFT